MECWSVGEGQRFRVSPINRDFRFTPTGKGHGNKGNGRLGDREIGLWRKKIMEYWSLGVMEESKS